MNKECPSSNLQMIPIDKIEVLNSRDRNGKVFADIVGNIKNIGLKKPITVTPRTDAAGNEKFLLICGEGRLNAFKALGKRERRRQAFRSLSWSRKCTQHCRRLRRVGNRILNTLRLFHSKLGIQERG